MEKEKEKEKEPVKESRKGKRKIVRTGAIVSNKIEYNQFKGMNPIERDLELALMKNKSLDGLSDTSDGEDCTVPLKALDRVNISEDYGIVIPAESGLEMSYVTKVRDCPTSTYGNFEIGIHYVSPVREILHQMEEDRMTEIMKIASTTKARRQMKTKSITRNTLIQVILHDRWWESPSTLFSTWKTIQYAAPHLPFPYHPHRKPLIYDGKKVKLTPVQEQMVAPIVSLWDHMTDKRKETWLEDFRNTSSDLEDLTDVEKIDLTAIRSAKRKKQKPNYGTRYTIVDGKVRMSTYEPYYGFMLRPNGKIRDQLLPEGMLMNGSVDTVIPPCPVLGHNWQSVTCQVGAPWVMHSLGVGNGRHMRADDGLRVLRLSYHVEDMFRKIRCVPSCYEAYRSFVTSNLQSPNLMIRQQATVLWLQDHLTFYAYTAPRGEKASLQLLVEDVKEAGGFCLLVSHSAECQTTIDFDTYPDGRQVYANILEFCKEKEKDAAVFNLVRRADVEEQMRLFYADLTPFVFAMFHLNMVVNRVLQEPVEGVSEEELVKYYSYVILFAKKIVGTRGNEDVLEMMRLGEKEEMLEAQLEALRKMKEKVKKGEKVVLMTKEERELMRPKPIDKKAERKRMKKEYKEMMKMAEEEKNRSRGQRQYVKRTFEEWEQEWNRMLATRVKEEDEKRDRIRHLFEKQPSLSEVKQRIKGFEARLESVQTKIDAAKSKSVSSSKSVVKRSVDPRITVAWCKRVRLGWRGKE